MSTIKTQGLLELLSRSLGQAPARAGMRLRPERELAAKLGVGRRRVALAVNKLAEQGVLVRRVGSGTYLRYIPPATDGNVGRMISPADLFSGHASATVVRDLSLPRTLKLGVGWLTMSGMSRANRLALDGLLARAQELGHTLTIHPMGVPDEAGFYQTVQLLAQHQFDGLLVCALDFIALRLEHAAQTLRKKLPPLAYFFSADAPPALQPVVMIDSSGAARQAATQFAAEGFREVAIINLTSRDATVEAFAAAARTAGLTHRASFAQQSKAMWVEMTEADVIHCGRRCAAELLDSSNPPEAVYVADDVMMLGVAEILTERGLIPGRDLGVIALANAGGPIPPTHRWSRLLMDPGKLGRLAVDLMIDVINQDNNHPPANLRLDARWCPGDTHIKSR